MRTLRLAWELEKAALRAQLSYRVDFFVLVVMGAAYQASGFAFIWVVLRQYHQIGGWSFRQIAVLYALRLLAHAVWLGPFNQIEYLDTIIREGRFDRILLRPLNPLLQVMTGRFEMNVIGDIITAVGFFIATAVFTHLDLSPAHVAYLVLAVIGGALAEGAFVLATSALAFRLLQIWTAQYLVDTVFLMFGSYPVRIFGRVADWTLTWIIPVAFVAYIPSGVILNKTGGLHVAPVVAWGAPVVGIVWFCAAYRVWTLQLRRYQSSGT
jgi:ABC-2 type transport system permease protein